MRCVLCYSTVERTDVVCTMLATLATVATVEVIRKLKRLKTEKNNQQRKFQYVKTQVTSRQSLAFLYGVLPIKWTSQFWHQDQGKKIFF